MIIDWKDDLLQEKNLSAVFHASRALPKSTFNRTVFWLCTAISLSICALWLSRSDVAHSAAAALSAADIAFNLSAQILGFLIGGFAIFATVSDPNLMIRLAQAEMDDTKLSVFKYIFFSFLSVFYVYVLTLGLSSAVKLLSSSSAISIPEYVDGRSTDIALVSINSIVFVFVVDLSAIAILRLKSFIWNIYQALITFLVAADVMKTADDPPNNEI